MTTYRAMLRENNGYSVRLIAFNLNPSLCAAPKDPLAERTIYLPVSLTCTAINLRQSGHHSARFILLIKFNYICLASSGGGNGKALLAASLAASLIIGLHRLTAPAAANEFRLRRELSG